MRKIESPFSFVTGKLKSTSFGLYAEGNNPAKPDRQAAVSGSFYPDDKAGLQKAVESYFNQAPASGEDQPLALIVPHAGFVFSGSVAAAGFKQIDREARFKRIFLIGSSHTTHFNGAAVSTAANFVTPLGKVEVDSLAATLTHRYKFIADDEHVHRREHSLEVQLPFLQYWLHNPFRIVPLIIGGGSVETCRQLASALEPYFNDENLFVVSTDFSHYPGYEDAKISDNILADAVLTNSSSQFLKAKQNLENKGIDHLVTAMCGWTSVLTLLNLTENKQELSLRKVLYKNSGDSPYGGKDKVVGYCAIEVLKNSSVVDCKTDLGKEAANPLVVFSDSGKTAMLKIAREAISGYLKNGTIPEVDRSNLPKEAFMQAGVFVTLRKNGKLRGCIGNFKSDEPLYKTIQSMAIAAATRDSRFNPVLLSDVKKLKIEISVLTPMRKINSIDEIDIGRHGIYLKKGNRKGTFLPKVATDTDWSKEEFLGHCARDKAGIGWNGWRYAEIFVYEAIDFGD